MFGLMTKTEHDRVQHSLRCRCERLQIDNAALEQELTEARHELARIRPIAEKAEARKAQALANLKQNKPKATAA